MGKSGAGKDTLLKALLKEPPFNTFAVPIISCTTRPIRENEKDGVDYHFITIEQFTNLVLNGEMLEATEFNNWHYGTALSNLSKVKLNIGVFNPEGIELLRENPDVNLTLIYIEARDKDRLIR
jgi:guanylate kinase